VTGAVLPQVIVLAHRLDIAPAFQLSRQVPEARRIVVCPHLADRCRAEGLEVELLAVPDVDPMREHYSRSRAMAYELHVGIDALLAGLDAQAPGCDWIQQDLFYALYNANGYAALWSQAIEVLGDVHWHVMLPDQPWRYGCHSFLPSVLLLERLRGRGRRFSAYSHALPRWDEVQLPDLAALHPDARPEVLVHLPTCFYDHQHFERALIDSGRSLLKLPSQHYDVELPQVPGLPLVPLSSLQAALPDDRRGQIDAVVDAVRSHLLLAWQTRITTPQFLGQQVSALAENCRQRLVLSAHLEMHLGSRPPHTLLMSNHDAGLHGPLLSFARRHRCRVLMVPHSKIFNAPVPAAPLDLRALTHPVQGMPVHDRHGRAVATHALAFPEQIQWSSGNVRPLRSLGVLLPGLSYNGLCGGSLPRFVQGLRELRDFCQAHGIRCRIRSKPSEPMISLLCRELGLAEAELLQDMGGSLDEFGSRCDLCLTFDVATSAAIELMRRGVPTLHAQLRPLILEETALMDPGLVPSAMLSEVLERLRLYAADGSHLWAFGRDQHLAYLRSWAAAQPLVSLLRA